MNRQLKCFWALLMVCQTVATMELQQAHFTCLSKGSRPSDGKVISNQTVASRATCGLKCLNCPACTSFVVWRIGPSSLGCELRDQSGVNQTSIVQELTANYYTRKGIDMLVHTVPARDCTEIYGSTPSAVSGVYKVTPDGGQPIDVYCDMDTEGGGWLVFQRRFNGSVDFYRNWTNYAEGFGEAGEEFWLGNRNLHLLTSQGNYTLRVDLGDWEGNDTKAEYEPFKVGSEQTNFTLTLGGFSGNAGDSMYYHRDNAFSTYDQDNDKWLSNCASTTLGAWWYRECLLSNLNGHYYTEGTHDPSPRNKGLVWASFRGRRYSLKTTKMMIKPS